MSILASRLGSTAPCPRVGFHVSLAEGRPQLRTSNTLYICISELPEAIRPSYTKRYTINVLLSFFSPICLFVL